MKVALVYDRRFLPNGWYWKRGGVWSAYMATERALLEAGVEVTGGLGCGVDAAVFWDALEAHEKYEGWIREADVPVLVKLGGYFGGDPDDGIPWGFLNTATCVVVSSPDMMDEVYKRCGSMVRWVPDGYDPGIFYPASDPGEGLVANCGLDESKGARFVAECGLPVRVAGTEGEIGTHAGFMGYVPHEEMGDFLREGKIYLSLIGPSMGFTISRLEAMACGLPMVCSDQGWQGLTEGTAYVIPLDDLERNPTVVREAVERLTVRDLGDMREAALRKAEEFTPEKVGQMWVDVLEELT